MKIEMLKVTRNEVKTAVKYLFAGKPTIVRQMCTDLSDWTYHEIDSILYPCEAFDRKGRTLGKFDQLSEYHIIKARTGLIPTDREYMNEFAFPYITECCRHSCGVRNWFRDVDQYAVADELESDEWLTPFGSNILTPATETTRRVMRYSPLLHEWYVMTRAFSNPYFVAKYTIRNSRNFSVDAYRMLTTYFWDLISAQADEEEQSR